MLKKQTENYIAYFGGGDLAGIESMLTEDFVLEDPVVKRIEGKSNTLIAIKAIFDSCNSLSFEAKNIFVDNHVSIIEFILKLDSTTLTGVDIIEWNDGKMQQLRAYLDIPK